MWEEFSMHGAADPVQNTSIIVKTFRHSHSVPVISLPFYFLFSTFPTNTIVDATTTIRVSLFSSAAFATIPHNHVSTNTNLAACTSYATTFLAFLRLPLLRPRHDHLSPRKHNSANGFLLTNPITPRDK